MIDKKYIEDSDIKSYYYKYNIVYRIIISTLLRKLILTRKCKSISASIVKGEFIYWSKFKQYRVISAMQAYLKREYYKQNKSEKYLRGIIRNIDDNAIGTELLSEDIIDKLLLKLKRKTIYCCKECEGKGYITGFSGEKLIVTECQCLVKYRNAREKIKKYNRVTNEIL